MRSMTPELWAENYPLLRKYVRDQWPEVDEGKLNAIVGDFEALVELLASTEGISSDLARQQLLSLDIPDEDAEGVQGEPPEASLDQLRVGPGFSESERDWLVENLERLNRRLRRFPSDAVDMEISVQERGETSQEVVLEAWLPKFPHMAATSGQENLGTAVREVRDNMWRQIDDAVNRRKEHR